MELNKHHSCGLHVTKDVLVQYDDWHSMHKDGLHGQDREDERMQVDERLRDQDLKDGRHVELRDLHVDLRGLHGVGLRDEQKVDLRGAAR